MILPVRANLAYHRFSFHQIASYRTEHISEDEGKPEDQEEKSEPLSLAGAVFVASSFHKVETSEDEIQVESEDVPVEEPASISIAGSFLTIKILSFFILESEKLDPL